ncbi:hypothetical protein CLV98_10175 [Dyadobacter jejuensis]|uniref:Uncharacterized protein n=1 Tax=Dyadobacter jejuensis TaxID=1082580 RepID=A0A316AR44_9BACT|nr:hypothetical protein [Dyadobacter jejuensis]PWJ59901.1 hypothetical protein CLV98_10175 [Dyadobacter jejuensis]
MQGIINFFVVFILALVGQLLAPWWMIALVPFAVQFWRPVGFLPSFLSSFLGIALLWLGYGWYQHSESAGILSERMAQVFSLPNAPALLAITVLVGGLMGGLAGLAGFSVKNIFMADSSR